MTLTVTSALVDSEVKFQSKSQSDPTEWSGVIIGVGDYRIAQTYTDIVAYNSDVQKADPTVGDYNTLHYFILKLDNQAATAYYAFAQEWVDEGSFVVVQNSTIFHIDVYSSTTDPTTLLNLLASNNYQAYLTSTTAASS
jgi:hypothetical protein